MALLEFSILLIILIFLLYKWSIGKYQVLEERNVPHEKPAPLIGNIGIGMFFGKQPFLKFFIDLHEKYKNKKVYGIYSLRVPLIFINDLELIKKIGIKDAENFINHGATLPDDNSEICRSLLMLKDRKWKEMRNTLTPTFTGSKMRLLYPLIDECSKECIKYLENATENQEFEFEMKDFFTRFTNDVIASAAFGIKVNSFQDKENDFYSIGIKVTQFTGMAFVKSILYELIPNILRKLGVKVFDAQKVNYFGRLVLDAIKHREENKIIRPDMINLLMEAKRRSTELKTENETTNEQQAELTDRDIVAQCLLFFFAGFETVSTCLCFTLHELMENPGIQEKLYEEIKEMQEKLNGQTVSYDDLMKMKYMDMVLSESLRKWPPNIMIDRICTKDYNLLDEDENLVVALKKDDIVWFPLLGLQRDAANFENPKKFEPERFSDENKNNIKPFTYMPFGIGPRNCIGNRFAMMEVKSILYYIILRFKILRSEKSAKDLMNSIMSFQMTPKEKYWIKVMAREN